MTKYVLVVAAVLGVAAGVLPLPCLAHDLVTPPWRGAAAGTFQEWRFGTSANPASPEVVTNPNGSPTAAINVGPYGSGWLGQLPGMGTQFGYWDMGSAGIVTCNVPNGAVPPPGCSMLVSVQATYFRDITQAPTVVVTGGTRIRGQTIVVENVPTGGDWRLDQSYWRVPAAPAMGSTTVTSSSQWGSVVDQVVVDAVCPKSPGTVGQTKPLPDGTLVDLTGPIVTRIFETYFYIEDAQRIAGIRVNCDPSQMPAEGTMPTVVGTLRTINGERVLDQSFVFAGSAAAIPGVFAMNNTATFCGLNPQGLRVVLAGRASVPQGATTFTIQDGSVKPIRVELHGVAAPADGRFVVVTGVLGGDLQGPILRVNARDSVRVCQ